MKIEEIRGRIRELKRLKCEAEIVGVDPYNISGKERELLQDFVISVAKCNARMYAIKSRAREICKYFSNNGAVG